MRVIKRTSADRTRWDALCDESADAWLFHHSTWIDVELGLGGKADHSFAIEDRERLCAVAPLYVSELGLGPFSEILVHNGLHRHTGLAFAPDLSQSERKQAYALWRDRLVLVAESCDADRIHLAQQNLAPIAQSSSRDELPAWVIMDGFHLGLGYGPNGIAPAPGVATTVVDQIVRLDADAPTMFSRLKESCRRAVRKAERSGATVQDATSTADAVDRYYELAKQSAKRSGETLPEKAYYRAIHDGLSTSCQCKFLFVRIDDTDVAASILLVYKDGIHFLSGVSAPKFLHLRVNDYLHWSAIKLGHEAGYTHYRLGPYFPSVPKGWPIEKLSRFKTKFGAKQQTIIQGSLFRKPQRYAPVAAEYCKQIASVQAE